MMRCYLFFLFFFSTLLSAQPLYVPPEKEELSSSLPPSEQASSVDIPIPATVIPAEEPVENNLSATSEKTALPELEGSLKSSEFLEESAKTSSAFSGEKPSAGIATPAITLDEVLQSTINCGWAIWISEAQQLNQAGIWRESRGNFDPTFTAEFNRLWREKSQEIDRGKSNRDGRQTDWRVGLNKLFYGGTELSANLFHFKEVDPLGIRGPQRNQYTWQINLRQPLLRDFLCGELHTAVQSEWDRYTAASWQFVHDTAATLFAVSQGYWNLYFRQQTVKIRSDTITELEELEKSTQRLVEMGRIPNSQLFQQRAEIANEKRNLCEAIQEEQNGWLQLQVAMGWDPSCSCETLVPHVANRPDELILTERDCEESIWLGLTHRSDLKAELLRVSALEKQLAGSENALMPELDLIASIGQLNHEVGRNAKPFFSSFNADAPEQNYLLGVSFSFPLWNQTARGRFQQSCNQLREQKSNAELLSAQIAANIRSSVVELENRRCQLDAARDAVKWFGEAKEAEILRWKAGYSTLFVVIDFIRREANAKVSLVIAESTYGNAYINYLFQTGTWVTSDPCFRSLDVTVICKECQDH